MTSSIWGTQDWVLSPSDDQILASWAEFKRRYPNEEACMRAICQLVNCSSASNNETADFVCSNCSSENVELVRKCRVIQCEDCKFVRWITAGTFFAHIRSAVPWLAAIWFYEQKILISSQRLHQLSGISQSTAWNILKKISMVLESCLNENLGQLPSSMFSEVISKRSFETPARESPRAELKDCDVVCEAQIQENKISDYSDSLSVIQSSLLDAIGFEPKQIEEVCSEAGVSMGEVISTVSILEIYGLVKSIPGGKVVRQLRQVDKVAEIAVEDLPEPVFRYLRSFIRLVGSIYHGISRKYLQLYALQFWFLKNKSKWTEGSLLRACQFARRIKESEVRSYLTPSMVYFVFEVA